MNTRQRPPARRNHPVFGDGPRKVTTLKRRRKVWKPVELVLLGVGLNTLSTGLLIAWMKVLGVL